MDNKAEPTRKNSSPETLTIQTNVKDIASSVQSGSSGGPPSKDGSDSSKVFTPESDDSMSSANAGSGVSEGYKILPGKKSKSGLQMLFKTFRKAFTPKSDVKLSNKGSQSDDLGSDGGSVSDVSRKNASDSSSESGSIRRNSLPKLSEPLSISTSKIDKQKSKTNQSSSPLSSPVGVKKMFPTDKGPVKLCRICERFIAKNDFEQHCQLCVLNHEYKVKMKGSDNKLRKYVTIVSSRRKMLKAVCF